MTWVIPQVKAILPLKYQASVINHKVANTTDKIYTIIFLPAEEHVDKIKSNLLWNKRESPQLDRKYLQIYYSKRLNVCLNVFPGKRLNVCLLKLEKSKDVHFTHLFERSSQCKKKLNLCKLEKKKIYIYIHVYM